MYDHAQAGVIDKLLLLKVTCLMRVILPFNSILKSSWTVLHGFVSTNTYQRFHECQHCLQLMNA